MTESSTYIRMSSFRREKRDHCGDLMEVEETGDYFC